VAITVAAVLGGLYCWHRCPGDRHSEDVDQRKILDT